MGLVLATIIMKPDVTNLDRMLITSLVNQAEKKRLQMSRSFLLFSEVWDVSIIFQPYFLLKSEGLSSPMYELQVGTEKLELQPKKNAYHFQRIYWLSRKLHKF